MRAILLLSCEDQKGLVAAISNFISDNGGNILNLDEHVDSDEKMFFIRVEWEIGGLHFGKDELHLRFEPLAEQFNAESTVLIDAARIAAIIKPFIPTGNSVAI